MSETTGTRRPTGMKVVALVTIIALALGLTGGWLISTLTSGGGSDEGDLWVVQAREATLDDGTLTMSGLTDSLVEVELEDGSRQASAVPISRLMQDWADEFDDNAPNAVLTGAVDGSAQSLAVTLGDPAVDGDAIVFSGTEVLGGGRESQTWDLATLVIDTEGLITAEVEDRDQG